MVKQAERYTDTFYYDLEFTTKFLRLFSVEFFKRLNTNLNQDEYVTIETILCNAGICQRDLAKIILKDRANTGKILNTLEEKGYITRFVDMKNNRLVRKMGVTEEGKKVYDEVTLKLKAVINETIHNEKNKKFIISDEEIDYVRDILKKLRENLKQIVDIQI